MFTSPFWLFMGVTSILGLVHFIPEVVREMKGHKWWLFLVFLVVGFIVNLASGFLYIFLDIYVLPIPMPDSPINIIISNVCVATHMAVVPTVLTYCISVYFLKRKYGLLPMKFSLIVTFLLFLQPIVPAVIHRWF